MMDLDTLLKTVGTLLILAGVGYTVWSTWDASRP